MQKKQDNIVNSLAHTKRNCKYHIVFALQYRRKIFIQSPLRDGSIFVLRKGF